MQFAPIVAEATDISTRRVDVTIRHHGQESYSVYPAGEKTSYLRVATMMQARSVGIDIVNWATMYQTYPATLIVKADSGIESADLEGNRLACPAHAVKTTSHCAP